MSKLYLVSVTVIPQREGMDMLFLSKLGSLVKNYSSHTNVLYKFKVTGEPQILAIIDVADVVGLERMIAGLYRLGSVSVTCSPLYCYENFANYLGVDPCFISTPGALPNNDLYWLEFDVECHGKTIGNLKDIWMNEALAVMKARADGLQIILYKVLMERKVHCFLSVPDIAKLDELSFSLPIMSANGENVRIKCKAVQHLDDFLKIFVG